MGLVNLSASPTAMIESVGIVIDQCRFTSTRCREVGLRILVGVWWKVSFPVCILTLQGYRSSSSHIAVFFIFHCSHFVHQCFGFSNKCTQVVLLSFHGLHVNFMASIRKLLVSCIQTFFGSLQLLNLFSARFQCLASFYNFFNKGIVVSFCSLVLAVQHRSSQWKFRHREVRVILLRFSTPSSLNHETQVAEISIKQGRDKLCTAMLGQSRVDGHDGSEFSIILSTFNKDGSRTFLAVGIARNVTHAD